jgi:hypothetical protein
MRFVTRVCVITNLMYSRPWSERTGNVPLYSCLRGPVDGVGSSYASALVRRW